MDETGLPPEIHRSKAPLGLAKRRPDIPSNSLAQVAWSLIAAAAPIVAPLLKNSKHPLAKVFGGLAEIVPNLQDSMQPCVEVAGTETVVFLDDSFSMSGTNLDQGKSVLREIQSLLQDSRTRIVKFGSSKSIILPRGTAWSPLLASSWDASSGGTYMWHMIKEDVESMFVPAGGKLRLIVITDGFDCESPEPFVCMKIVAIFLL